MTWLGNVWIFSVGYIHAWIVSKLLSGWYSAVKTYYIQEVCVSRKSLCWSPDWLCQQHDPLSCWRLFHLQHLTVITAEEDAWEAWISSRLPTFLSCSGAVCFPFPPLRHFVFPHCLFRQLSLKIIQSVSHFFSCHLAFSINLSRQSSYNFYVSLNAMWFVSAFVRGTA